MGNFPVPVVTQDVLEMVTPLTILDTVPDKE